MTFWSIHDRRDITMAEAGWHGAWSKGVLCPECGTSSSERVPPLIMEWIPGSDTIGDFVCTAICDGFVLKSAVALVLSSQFHGIKLGSVEMIQDPKLNRPTRPTKRTKSRVWLPYDGPQLHELLVPTFVPIDQKRSTARLVKKCSACEYERWELDCIEHTKSHWDKRRGVYMRVRIPRERGKGMLFEEKNWGASMCFAYASFRAGYVVQTP